MLALVVGIAMMILVVGALAMIILALWRMP